MPNFNIALPLLIETGKLHSTDTRATKENQNTNIQVSPLKQPLQNVNNKLKNDSTVDTMPNYSQKMGFYEEQFDLIKSIAKINKTLGRKTVCALIANETKLLPKIEKNVNKNVGKVTLFDVNSLDQNQDSTASKAICLMIVSLTENWKIPLSLSFINTIPPKVFGIVIKACLFKLHIMGVDVVSITTDCNTPYLGFYLANELGALIHQLKAPVVPYFEHTFDQKTIVNIIYDLPSLVDNIRTLWKKVQTMRDINHRIIDHSLVKMAKDIKEDTLRNLYGDDVADDWLIIQKRLLYDDQYISKTQADALEYLKNLAHPPFVDAQGTIIFIRVLVGVDSIFDAKIDDATSHEDLPLKKENKNEWKPTWKKIINYLENLKPEANDEASLTMSFKGIVITLKSLLNIFDIHVDGAESAVPYLLPERFSLRHMRSIFENLRPPAGRYPTAAEVYRYYQSYRNKVVPVVKKK